MILASKSYLSAIKQSGPDVIIDESHKGPLCTISCFAGKLHKFLQHISFAILNIPRPQQRKGLVMPLPWSSDHVSSTWTLSGHRHALPRTVIKLLILPSSHHSFKSPRFHYPSVLAASSQPGIFSHFPLHHSRPQNPSFSPHLSSHPYHLHHS